MLHDYKMIFHKCEKCGNETNFFTSHRSETYPVLGEDITVFTPHFICAECRAIVFDEKLDDESLKAAYDIYRKKHNLCNPNIIKGICDTQHITIEKLSEVTGISAMRLNQLQNGSVPNELESNMLKMVSMTFIYEILAVSPSIFPPSSVLNTTL